MKFINLAYQQIRSGKQEVESHPFFQEYFTTLSHEISSLL